MIEEGSGNLLTADVDAIVNTVNTVGVMGKGIALQVKRAFPDVYDSYRAAHDRGELRIGRMHVHDRGVLGPARYVINFPTKRHWRSPSRLADIDAGLTDLVRVVRELGLTSIAVPALGAGNGGLDWADVRPRIEAALAPLTDVRVVLYPPAGAPSPAVMPVATPRPTLSRGHARLLLAVERYEQWAATLEPRGPGVSHLEIQKLAYLLQDGLRVDLGLRFARAHYGPYAQGLTTTISDMEGHQTLGYGDGTDPVLDFVSIELLPGATDEARAVLSDEAAVPVDALQQLVDGYESPYGMELLATVHWAAHRVDPATRDPEVVSGRVAGWNLRKARLFTPHHVSVTMQRLARHDLLPGPT
jgi:O-acetyl-ADP-ribose deacetylase (regulator of RNase III)